MRCLVVDDSTTMRRILGRVVRALGDHEIVEAADGRDALNQAGDGVDLLITDWNMPGMGGLELVKNLRASPQASRMRVLMVSGRDTEGDVVQAVQAGVDDYILKPFSLDALRGKIERLITP